MQLFPWSLLLALIVLVSTSPLTFVPETSFSDPVIPTLLGRFKFSEAAFSSVDPSPNSDGTKYDLLLSAFGVFTSEVAYVPDVGRFLKDVSSIYPKSLTKGMKWPNSVSGVPGKVLGGKTAYVSIPDGFLVPTKGKGSVTLLPLSGGDGHIISSSEGDWFYHRVIWADMDKDGTLDALTAQANKPVVGSTKSNLIFFSNPKNHSLATPWAGHVIAPGPDALFTMANLTIAEQGQLREAIITTEYFNPRLRIFWSEDPKQDWSNSKMLKFRDIEEVPKSAGAPFDALVADLNADGKQEIIVTFNDAKNGSIVIYEVPSDFRTGKFKRHLLASGFKTEVTGLSTGGPGVIKLLEKEGEKPTILLSGDDSGLLTVFTPLSQDWSYNRTDILHTQKSTVGGISVADVDGDGRLEIFAPSYNEGYVYVYKV